jgi:hypothetical protein
MLAALLALSSLHPSTDEVKLNHARDLHRQLSELLRLEVTDLDNFELTKDTEVDDKISTAIAAGHFPRLPAYTFPTKQWSIRLDNLGRFSSARKRSEVGGAILPGDDGGALKVAEIIFGKDVTLKIESNNRTTPSASLFVSAHRSGYEIGKISVQFDKSGALSHVRVNSELVEDYADICDSNPAPSREQVLTWADRYIKQRVKNGAGDFVNLGMGFGVRHWALRGDPTIQIPAATRDRLQQGLAVPLVGAGFENKALKRWVLVVMDARDGSLLTFIEDDLYPIGR